MSLSYTIRTERSGDEAGIAGVHRLAFGPSEPIPALVQRLRSLNAPLPTMSFVACDANGAILGHVMMSHGWIDAPQNMIDILILSPLGVTPHAQKQGVGTALLDKATKTAMRTAAPILALEGNPAYYGPRGFEPAKSYNIRRPSLRIPEKALQIVRLPSYDPEISGSLVYRDLWWELDCVGLR